MADEQQQVSENEHLNGGDAAYRVLEPGAMAFRDAEDGSPILEGKMMPYGEWTEINSRVEGHFMETFAPGALAKTLKEQAARIKMLFEHGRDATLGRQTIAELLGFRDEPDGAYYKASPLDGIPPLILSGLKRGLYGASILFEPIKWDRSRFPGKSDHNPRGIEEHTIREAAVREISITAFPAYQSTSASVRSITDEVAARALLGDPVQLLEVLNTLTEPQHSAAEPEAISVATSRSTQPPSRDYLRPQEGSPSWRL